MKLNCSDWWGVFYPAWTHHDLPQHSTSSSNDGYKLSVKVTPRGEFPTEQNRSLKFISTDSLNIFIQTDKPVYKPNDEVKYRVLVLDRNFQPFVVSKSTMVVIIVVQDTVGNIIHSVFDAKVPPKRGMISNKFTLSREPTLGKWSIKVYLFEKPESSSSSTLSYARNFTQFYETQPAKASNGNFIMESLVFKVEEYIAPKFKLNLKISPSFVTFASPKFIASVNPTYTFGKPVYGKCSFVHKRLNTTNGSREVTKTLIVQDNSTSNSL